MTKDEFYQMLSQNDVEVTFTKKSDNTIRVMRCTENAPKNEITDFSPRRKKMPEDLITAYDTDAKGWRSLYADSIIEVKPLDSTFGLLQE